MKHLNITIEGMVQGVFFRASAREEARQLGLRGFVRNEMNGTVYAEVEGEEAQVNSFVMWCHHGPPSAHVDRVTVTEGPMQNWTSFGVRYS